MHLLGKPSKVKYGVFGQISQRWGSGRSERTTVFEEKQLYTLDKNKKESCTHHKAEERELGLSKNSGNAMIIDVYFNLCHHCLINALVFQIVASL